VGALPPTKGTKHASGVPEVPLKRLLPWSRDNRFLTDLIAGVVDTQGQFRGLVLRDIDLTAVKHFLQLSRTRIPETLSSEFRGLSEVVDEGYPIIIVTRGAYGRMLDPKDGPARNSARERVWELVRAVRQEMPRMNITCVDAPAHATTAEIARCSEPPLNQYRELAYYDGVWYAPEATPADEYLKWASSNPRKPLVHAAVRNFLDAKPGGGFKYDSKEFGWVPRDFSSYYSICWKPVHTEAGYSPAPVDAKRLAYDASKPLWESDPTAVANYPAGSQKANAALVQHKPDEPKEVLREVREVFTTATDAVDAAAAVRTIVDAHLGNNDFDAALRAAREARNELKTKRRQPEAEAMTLVSLALAMKASGSLSDAVGALREACAQFRSVNKKAQEATALKEMAAILKDQQDYIASRQVLDNMLSLAEDDLPLQVQGLLLSTRLNLEAGASWESVETVANQAVDVAEKASDVHAIAVAKCLMSQGLVSCGRAGEALKLVKEAESVLRGEHEVGEPLAEVHLCAAQVSLALDYQHSALWSAKQALVAASASNNDAIRKHASQIITRIQSGSGKAVNIGPPTTPAGVVTLQIF